MGTFPYGKAAGVWSRLLTFMYWRDEDSWSYTSTPYLSMA
jgi:hypothetical protein